MSNRDTFGRPTAYGHPIVAERVFAQTGCVDSDTAVRLLDLGDGIKVALVAHGDMCTWLAEHRGGRR